MTQTQITIFHKGTYLLNQILPQLKEERFGKPCQVIQVDVEGPLPTGTLRTTMHDIKESTFDLSNIKKYSTHILLFGFGQEESALLKLLLSDVPNDVTVPIVINIDERWG